MMGLADKEPCRQVQILIMAAASFDKESLIEAVRRYPCLCDTTREEYKNELIRENAWRNVCNEVLEKTYQNEKELIEGMCPKSYAFLL